MGTTSTTVTANWTIVQDANGSPTTVSGDDVTVYVNQSTPFFTGEAWSDVDLMAAIPSGATITNVTFDLGVETIGARQFSGVPMGPDLTFIDKAEYLADTFIAGYGTFGRGGPGDIPNDNDPHHITYDNSVYPGQSGGAGIADPAGFAAALSDVSTPVILMARGPNGGATGAGITYSAPLTIAFFYDDAFPCDTDVAMDLSTAVFNLNDGGSAGGQYVDGVIATVSGGLPEYWFDFALDPTKRYRVTVEFDPLSSHDGDGDPLTSDRFVLLRDALPGDENSGDNVQIGDGFSNTADVCTLTIGPGRGNWDDPDLGVAQGYTRLLFQTSQSGAVSAITIRKICKTLVPPLRVYPRPGDRFASSARVWPTPHTIQASNRRGPSAIL